MCFDDDFFADLEIEDFSIIGGMVREANHWTKDPSNGELELMEYASVMN